MKGLVQGVGFRPFIYVLALKHNIKGWVENRNDGVVIKAEGAEIQINDFITSIRKEKPAPANIYSLEKKECKIEGFTNFQIQKSNSFSNEITEISPDIAVCENCLSDLSDQIHRISYPFINCTNCGPRFTIIQDLPYDRAKTTMSSFPLCPICEKEYKNVFDRRFHAQPVACNHCGPEYQLVLSDKQIIRGITNILTSCKEIIDFGGVISIKGLGGYNLACNALDENAVNRLRNLKKREGKPFAVMFRNIEKIKEFAQISTQEENSLTSWRKPIVLVKIKKELATSVSNGLDTVGIMLPYLPFHYLLFEVINTPVIVLTSGNLSDEPIIIDNELALNTFYKITDAVVTNNREIYNRTDDSVIFVENEVERVVRRSRGYVPSPINVMYNAEGIFASGAELVNCFCIGKGNQAILSQHIGDLKNIETLQFYEESVNRFQKIFRFTPDLVACDMHPDYLSTSFAESLNLPITKIQHHHAHIASCMSEHNLDEKVIGISLDGVGYGTDGKIWGGEIFIADLIDFERFSHFEYMSMPGGDKATLEPWRMAVSYLYHSFGTDFLKLDIPFLKLIPIQKIELVIEMINKGINCPVSSSAGRLFDAVSAILNICIESSFHAEAPMRLESMLCNNTKECYSYLISDCISFVPTIKEIVNDLLTGINSSVISAKFHNTIIICLIEIAQKAKEKTGINKVVLSGGSFQNRYLLKNTEIMLKKHNFEVFSHCTVPSNDGGIALGQLAIASKRRFINKQ